jgi:hypothetical protein
MPGIRLDYRVSGQTDLQTPKKCPKQPSLTRRGRQIDYERAYFRILLEASSRRTAPTVVKKVQWAGSKLGCAQLEKLSGGRFASDNRRFCSSGGWRFEVRTEDSVTRSDRASDSGRRHCGGEQVHQHRERLALEVLETGGDHVARRIAMALRDPMINRHKPTWNAPEETITKLKKATRG